ncbi:3'-5' exonuclease [Acaryochloris sp. CCMEE 5410]|uniref:3'-5' exonuclease n=1 Tax=Acaryochloris sp. CCMEE 5410 TaxID=310037 RepID=UPI0021D2AB14|nr:3'-5' exonuclease [Acaryochloris sp. CCMEE 5410]KAI9129903.1 hypothetical protein ON05_029995 [Acaryochloris sp. CCMEE 5410]
MLPPLLLTVSCSVIRILNLPRSPVRYPIQVYEGYTERDEGQWIAQRIQDLAAVDPDFAYYRVAVLARTHRRASAVLGVLAKHRCLRHG